IARHQRSSTQLTSLLINNAGALRITPRQLRPREAITAMVQLSNAVRRARSTTSALLGSPADSRKPSYALWALMVGWFMIGFDITVVMVANPSIKVSLDADYSKVIWVTSAYLLASTVPLLTTGRLGDRFGPGSARRKCT
ncbi:hypothetical protein OSI78_15300, partial [Mycobacterium ulcerans]